MRVRQGYRLPADREALLHKAIRLEWISLGFVLSIVLVMYLSMGSSQTMKMALLEDLLALVPPVVFLLAMRMRKRPPDEQHPYGYSRAILGIIGIGLGFWWADAAAASIIALDVLKDGSTHVRKAIVPTDGSETDRDHEQYPAGSGNPDLPPAHARAWHSGCRGASA